MRPRAFTNGGLAAGLALLACGAGCGVEDVELATSDAAIQVRPGDGSTSGPSPSADANGPTGATDATGATQDRSAPPVGDATVVDGRAAASDVTVVDVAVAPGDATTPARDAGVQDAGGLTSTCDAAPTGCRALGDPCGTGPDCCSTHCAAGVCVFPGTCAGAGATCTAAADCCSSLCEPVNGTTTRVCLAECRPDGSACQSASDCCTLACNNGTCGGTECLLENTDCTSNAQCCSNHCDPNSNSRCVLDPVALCRASGEDCTSGGGQPCCGVCDNTSKRCDPGPGICRVTEMICTQNTDCCSGNCADDGTGRTICMSACLAAATACHASFECCQGTCTGDPPACGSAPSTCGITGTSCAVGGACCSGECTGGTCQEGCVAPGL